ncbi:MAG: FdtA/QdtA family cupin domain-containing protein [Muribaculaceae bacterium]|nr:FdtA/QdtA family cupin domain-containing protein [Muribaculaceae bacterium]
MENPQPHIIALPKIFDPRGSLTFVEGGGLIPFNIARAYWIYDVPAGEERGGHSHIDMQQLLVATGGSFDVNVTDGFSSRTFTLNRPFEGLYIPQGIWRTITNFASGSVCLSLVNLPFYEEDYIRDFDEFMKLAALRGPIIR